MDIYYLSIIGSIIICVMMIGFGALFMNKTPKKDSLMGYRTKAAMKSQASWKMAHQYAGKGWFYLGIFVAIVSAVILIFSRVGYSRTMAIGLLVFQVLAALIIIPFTESKLSDSFDEEGNAK